MGLIEDALRDAFQSQVGKAPAVDDPAGRAIAAGTRLRRRRTTMAALATAACLALIGTAIAVVAPDQDAPPPVSPIGPTDFGPGLDLPIAVLDDDRMVLPSWRSFPLNLEAAAQAWRTSDGWLVQTLHDGITGLYYYQPGGGTAVPMVSGTGIAISADGQRIAWSDAGRVTVATRAGSVLSTTAQTGGTGGRRPLLFVGQAVLLGGATAVDGYDVWLPEDGPYQPTTGYRQPIFGVSADGTRLYAGAVQGMPCLVTLMPAKLLRDRSVCGYQLTGVQQVRPSPDGRWLAVSFADRVEVYEEAAIWHSPAPAQVWYTSSHGLTWVDGMSFVVSTGTGIMRFGIDEPTAGDRFTVADGPSGLGDVTPWVWPVPTLG